MPVPNLTLEDRRAIVAAHRTVLRFALDLWEGRDSLTVGELLALPVALRCVLCALLTALGAPAAVRAWPVRFITIPPVPCIH